MPPFASVIFVAAVFSTFFCCAVNLYTLQIAYPLWRSLPAAEFCVLHGDYLRRLQWVITVPHVVMFFSCGALVLVRPAALTLAAAGLLCLLTWTVVAVSAFMAGPVHDRFTRQRAWDEPGMRLLIRVSLARSIMMLGASALLLNALLTLLHAR